MLTRTVTLYNKGLQILFRQSRKKSLFYDVDAVRSFKGKTFKLSVSVAIVSAVIGGVYSCISIRERRKVSILFSGISRFLRSLTIGAVTSADYKWHLWRLDEDSVDYDSAIKGCHLRAANRILNGCLDNGGIYIKLGQGLSAMNHILPQEYTETLTVLLDRARTRGLNEVEQIFKEEFGRSTRELFREFNDVALAAASLAQVHKAITHDGQTVAVKIQYIDLRDRFAGDIMTCEILLKLVAFIHPNFGFAWILQDLKGALAQELDFEQEGRNGEQCQRDLSHLPYVYVPRIFWEYSSKRVLTTEFINGVRVSDVDGLEKLRIDLKRDVGERLVECFAEQIFRSGFVHADPHPGNIFVRHDSRGKVQLVLLDHGLYESLSPTQRVSLCHLYAAIAHNDDSAMKRYSQQLGVDDHRIFCEILVQRPVARQSLHLPSKMTKQEIESMKEMAREHFGKIMEVLKAMPRPMILLIRNMNIIRSINREHGNTVDRYSIMAKRAMYGCHYNRTFVSYIAARLHIFVFDFRLRKERLMTVIGFLYLRVLSYFRRQPDPSIAIKEIVDTQLKRFEEL